MLREDSDENWNDELDEEDEEEEDEIDEEEEEWFSDSAAGTVDTNDDDDAHGSAFNFLGSFIFKTIYARDCSRAGRCWMRSIKFGKVFRCTSRSSLYSRSF